MDASVCDHISAYMYFIKVFIINKFLNFSWNFSMFPREFIFVHKILKITIQSDSITRDIWSKLRKTLCPLLLESDCINGPKLVPLSDFKRNCFSQQPRNSMRWSAHHTLRTKVASVQRAAGISVSALATLSIKIIRAHRAANEASGRAIMESTTMKQRCPRRTRTTVPNRSWSRFSLGIEPFWFTFKTPVKRTLKWEPLFLKNKNKVVS